MITCKTCIMDSISDTEFKIDIEGICNYCNDFNKKKSIYFSNDEEKSNLKKIYEKF